MQTQLHCYMTFIDSLSRLCSSKARPEDGRLPGNVAGSLGPIRDQGNIASPHFVLTSTEVQLLRRTSSMSTKELEALWQYSA